MELYRHNIDHYVIEHAQHIRKKDATTKTETFTFRTKHKKGKRQYLKPSKTKEYIRNLLEHLQQKVEIAPLRHGKTQQLETLITQEPALLRNYIMEKKRGWKPRIVTKFPSAIH